MNHVPDHDLTTRLARKADEFSRRGGTELDIHQVVARAGEIKRGRRMRASIVMAASVLAIAAPTALVALDDAGETAPTPAPAVDFDHSTITLTGLSRGKEPQTGHVSDGRFRGAGDEVDLGAVAGRITDVAALRGGYLVAAQTESGERQVTFVDQSGNASAESRRVEGGFARSDDGQVGAFVQPDGVPVLVRDGGRGWTDLVKVPDGVGADAVAVTGEDCAVALDACSVWVNTSSPETMTWTVDAEGARASTQKPLRRVTDVAGQRVAGITEVRDDGTCSAVLDLDGSVPLWSTCEHRFVAFSPDGTRLLATGSYGDGLGDRQVAILDAESGDVLLDLPVTDMAFVSEMVWEDDTHVLAEVFEQGRWAVLRIALNGTREYAVAPVAGEDVESPFMLPTR